MSQIEFRELTREELDEIEGAFWANLAGAAVGAVAGGGVGAVNPIAGFTSAARTLGASAVGGAIAHGVDRAVYGRQ